MTDIAKQHNHDNNSFKGHAANAVPEAQATRRIDLHIEESWPPKMDQDTASACLLHVCGVVLAPKTLQKRRVVGGSPPFQKLGARVVYPRKLLVTWGHAQAGPVVNSTAELSAN